MSIDSNPMRIRRRICDAMECEIRATLADAFPFVDWELELFDCYHTSPETKRRSGHELWFWRAVRQDDTGEPQHVNGAIHVMIEYGSRRIHRSKIFDALGDIEPFENRYLAEVAAAAMDTPAERFVAFVLLAAIAVVALLLAVVSLPFVLTAAAIRWACTIRNRPN